MPLVSPSHSYIFIEYILRICLDYTPFSKIIITVLSYYEIKKNRVLQLYQELKHHGIEKEILLP